ncbi:MAG: SpoIID/LytB domain-containing protein [Lachnospiraceae bacterium]|nr:SpoIID/LytB domain-containing protein [Lachnospiraceae bacterium]
MAGDFWRHRFGMDGHKGQRMRLKLFICALGLLLLLILLLGRLMVALTRQGKSKEPESESIHIPVVEVLKNVWLMEVDENGIMVFKDGEEKHYAYEDKQFLVDYEYPLDYVREQVADVILTDEKVTELQLKTDKINGKILGADESGIQVEGYGRLEFAEDYKGYRIYQTLSMCTYRDIYFGYDFVDLVLEKGQVCALLMAKEEAMETIRVLINASDYAGEVHETVTLTADTDFTISYGIDGEIKQEVHGAGDVITIDGKSGYFEGDRIVVTPNVLTGKIALESVHRSQGTPKYRGSIELFRTDEGIIVINEVLLEEYLYCVLPSEMPASYPDEALKAQAVCARTYAYSHMRKAGYPQYGAHVDDSTSYQVYNNILEQESTTTAVKETYGQLLFTDEGECAETFYYSTSCGMGSDANVWKTESAAAVNYLTAKGINQNEMFARLEGLETERKFGEEMQEEEVFRQFITRKHAEDFEVEENWYRWSYQVKNIDVAHLRAVLQKRYEANEKLILTQKNGEYISREIGDFATVQDIYVAKRGAGGVADELVIETDEDIYKVITEHNIRWVLDDGTSPVICQNGKAAEFPNLLPSAFFVIDIGRERESVVGYTLTGGGYGHGAGMSQNAAKSMALKGYTVGEILCFFYENCSVENIYERE